VLLNGAIGIRLHSVDEGEGTSGWDEEAASSCGMGYEKGAATSSKNTGGGDISGGNAWGALFGMENDMIR
jgi:hypothetical protein